MNPLVRDLYKRFIVAGRGYPQGVIYVREKAKTAFFTNSTLDNEIEVKKAVAKGRYWVREIIAISQFHKFRAMRKYDPNHEHKVS